MMSRAHHTKTGEPSHRMLRVAELVRHAVSDVLSRGDVQDPALEKTIITVPKVKMSPDLKLATVYVLPLGGKDTKPVLDALEKNRKYLRGEVSRAVNLKSAPELRFRADDSFDNIDQIDALFRTEKVRADMVAPSSFPLISEADDVDAEDAPKADTPKDSPPKGSGPKDSTR